MDHELVNKYLRHEASETEVNEIFQWIDADPKNRQEFIGYKKIWALTAHAAENETEAWHLLFGHRFKKRRLYNAYIQIARYAAVVLLIFAAGMIFQEWGAGEHYGGPVYPQGTSITAPLGQMSNIELPDGTKVMLNSGTSITYNSDFSRGKRLVHLTGEAFFDVATDQRHEFVVQTASLNFIVHGTSFNIEAYPGENIVNTTLIEGSLGVRDQKGTELARLVPGENAYYDAHTAMIKVSKVDTQIFTSWKEGLITFRNEKLSDIARKIERWYNVEVIIKNPRLGEEAYFGTIMRNKPVDQILEVLSLTSSLNYKIIPRPDKPALVYWELKE